MSPETKARIAAALKGRQRSPEHCQAISDAHQGKVLSPEHRARIAESLVGQVFTAQRRGRISEAKRERDAREAVGFFIDQHGYRRLTGRQGHPLASRVGQVLEHRWVLFEQIGPGQHPCYWCGKLLDWGGRDGIQSDHVDGDRLNNDPLNLVPSCDFCNKARANAGNPVDWRPR